MECGRKQNLEESRLLMHKPAHLGDVLRQADARSQNNCSKVKKKPKLK